MSPASSIRRRTSKGSSPPHSPPKYATAWVFFASFAVAWAMRDKRPRFFPSEGARDAVARWASLATAAGAKYGVDPALILGMIEVESGGKANAVSPTGARGLMQVLCSTARGLGVTSCSRLFDPATAIDTGTKYLRQLWQKQQGDLDLTVASYFVGPNSWKLTRIGGFFISGDARTYVDKVITARNKYIGMA